MLPGPYIAGGGGGQLPPPGKLFFFSNIVFDFVGLFPVCIREIPVKVCGVCPRRQKILGAALVAFSNINQA